MKVLLDECVTRYLTRDLPGHEVSTVDQAGYKGLKNGQLLQAASDHFDVLITVDQNLSYQQDLKSYAIAVLVLVARSNAYAMLHPLMSEAHEALEKIQPGEVVIIQAAKA